MRIPYRQILRRYSMVSRLILLLILAQALVACSRGLETTPVMSSTASLTEPAATVTPEPVNTKTPAPTEGDVYPSPTQPESPDAYPGPGAGEEDPYPAQAEAYPSPVEPGLETSAGSPYPEPVETQAGTPSVTPATGTLLITGTATMTAAISPGATGTAGSTLAPPPQIGSSPSPSPLTTTPGGQTGTPQLTPPAGVVTGTITPTAGPTSPPATATTTPTPTLTPTLTEPDPEFHPTDPDEVRLDSGRVQLVEFFAYWCGTCRAMAPIIHRLEERYDARMNFIYLDVDNPDTLELKRELGYRRLPHLFLLDADGKILRSWGGSVTAVTIDEAIRGALD